LAPQLVKATSGGIEPQLVRSKLNTTTTGVHTLYALDSGSVGDLKNALLSYSSDDMEAGK